MELVRAWGQRQHQLCCAAFTHPYPVTVTPSSCRLGPFGGPVGPRLPRAASPCRWWHGCRRRSRSKAQAWLRWRCRITYSSCPACLHVTQGLPGAPRRVTVRAPPSFACQLPSTILVLMLTTASECVSVCVCGCCHSATMCSLSESG